MYQFPYERGTGLTKYAVERIFWRFYWINLLGKSDLKNTCLLTESLLKKGHCLALCKTESIKLSTKCCAFVPHTSCRDYRNCVLSLGTKKILNFKCAIYEKWSPVEGHSI